MNIRSYNDQWSYSTEGNVAFVPTIPVVSENSNLTSVFGFVIYDRGKDFGEKRFWGNSYQNNEKIATYDENERNLLEQAMENFLHRFTGHSELENGVPDIDDMMRSLEILREISKWDEDWSGNKIDPMPKKVMDTSYNIVRNLFHQPNICPTGRDSIQMEYHRSDRSYLEFEIFETEIICTEIPQRQYDKAKFQKLDLNENNLIRVALHAMGFTNEQITPHGFRAMFSTIANENGWNRDVIERQLAHVERNAVRGAYNHAEYMPERRKIMQWWADYLDSLEES